MTGKGGVGKTTVAAALGVAAARRGLRAIVAEVAARDDVTRALGGEDDAPRPRGRAGLRRAPHLDRPRGRDARVPRRPAALAHARRRCSPTAARSATSPRRRPGMRELLTIGKVWELAQEDRRTPGARPYDLVILDAPATGHGVAVLSRAAHVRRHRARRAHRAPGGDDRRAGHEPARAPPSSRSRGRRRCRSTRRSQLRDALERRARAAAVARGRQPRRRRTA